MENHRFIFPQKNLYLLIALIAYFLINALLVNQAINTHIFDAIFFIFTFLCIYAIAQRLIVIFLTLPFAIISMATHWIINVMTLPTKEIMLTHYLSNIIFLSLITYFILSSVAQQKKVTAETLLGAICGYLLIGLIWASIYQVIITLDPEAFSILGANMTSHPILTESIRARAQYFIYFSYVTLTTLGYGDILAISSVAKTFSWLEAMTGQIFLVIWISQLVSLYVVGKQHNIQHRH